MRFKVYVIVGCLQLQGLVLANAQGRAEIRPIQEEEVDKGPKDLPANLKRRRTSAIEFRDSDGKVKRRVDFSEHFRKSKPSEERFIELKKSRSGKRAVVELGVVDRSDKNPYHARRERKKELRWFDENGVELGRANVPSTARVSAVSSDGQVTAVIDAGFDQEELAHKEAPGVTHTDQLKNDKELTKHTISFLKPNGTSIVEQEFTELTAPPERVIFSPSGEWASYSLATSETFVRNLKTGSVESFPYQPLAWELEDSGRLIGWKNEGAGGKWAEFEGRKVWEPAKEIIQRKYIRPLGALEASRTEETRKLAQ